MHATTMSKAVLGLLAAGLATAGLANRVLEARADPAPPRVADARAAQEPDGPAQDSEQLAGPRDPARAELERAFAESGLLVDLDAGWCALPTAVEVTEDLLEYLLVGPAGAAHETLFSTEVVPSVLNTALLALGAERGSNARWFPKDPPPTDEQRAAGVSPFEVSLPEGTGFYLYAGWQALAPDGQAELYFFRVEDLLRNLTSGQSMQRHAWVYLGSSLVPHPTRRDEEVFAADIYHNLINVSFFSEGYTLMTSALEECLEQTIWIANAWLAPPRGTQVSLVFARERLASCPRSLLERLPMRIEATEGADWGR